MPWITPKMNWTGTDFYNAGDLNRVENNIAEVRSYLISIGYSIPTITTNTSRINTSYDLVSSINRIESNLNTIRQAFATPAGWQSTISWTAATKMTADHANRWETSAKLLYDAAQATYQGYRYAGTFNAGQEALP